MTDLSQLLNQPARDAVVADLDAVATKAVDEQSGLTGMAIKTALKTLQKVDSNIVSKGIDKALPNLLTDLQPRFDEFEATGETDFGAFLEPRSEEVAEDLLSTADGLVAKSSRPGVDKIYGTVRGKGVKTVSPYVAELGRVIQRHLA
ncbi:DUF6918 family protein [Corynebacterium uterequi]|uniref:Uncharacterized protein n=1 Tax=Corynebacterium uterequi TaxID=1072256 RepID=A0A0G3HFV2_9CORY|nr:hypothetical protein [Corynebacterium uterequi]AKK10047.1 hypothetical protein CUTER_00075 [Corynebacterium uterequi]